MSPVRTSSIVGKRAAWIAGAAVAIVAMPGAGNAACLRASGNGTWDVYATVVTGSPGWNRCSVTVTNGDVAGTCVTHTGVTNTVRGTLNAAPNCRVSGTLTHVFPGGARYTATIAQATLGADNDVIMGAARSNTGLLETFQGIRR